MIDSQQQFHNLVKDAETTRRQFVTRDNDGLRDTLAARGVDYDELFKFAKTVTGALSAIDSASPAASPLAIAITLFTSGFELGMVAADQVRYGDEIGPGLSD